MKHINENFELVSGMEGSTTNVSLRSNHYVKHHTETSQGKAAHSSADV